MKLKNIIAAAVIAVCLLMNVFNFIQLRRTEDLVLELAGTVSGFAEQTLQTLTEFDERLTALEEAVYG